MGEVEGKRFRGRPRMTLPTKIGKELEETSELGLRFLRISRTDKLSIFRMMT